MTKDEAIKLQSTVNEGEALAKAGYQDVYVLTEW
jgi:hypothetical protein